MIKVTFYRFCFHRIAELKWGEGMWRIFDKNNITGQQCAKHLQSRKESV